MIIGIYPITHNISVVVSRCSPHIPFNRSCNRIGKFFEITCWFIKDIFKIIAFYRNVSALLRYFKTSICIDRFKFRHSVIYNKLFKAYFISFFRPKRVALLICLNHYDITIRTRKALFSSRRNIKFHSFTVDFKIKFIVKLRKIVTIFHHHNIAVRFYCKRFNSLLVFQKSRMRSSVGVNKSVNAEITIIRIFTEITAVKIFTVPHINSMVAPFPSECTEKSVISV